MLRCPVAAGRPPPRGHRRAPATAPADTAAPSPPVPQSTTHARLEEHHAR
jgi:hypothetical protein